MYLPLSAMFEALIPDLKSLPASSAKSSLVSDSLDERTQHVALMP